MGKPAAAARTSCREYSMACTSSCESSCNSGRACPSGGAEACDPTCRTTCDKDCYDRESPSYQPSLPFRSLPRVQGQLRSRLQGWKLNYSLNYNALMDTSLPSSSN
jgi:hypothetical protein